ncbi:uncharacterized protein TNCV_3353601 [Trichonephila clavipes]|nr:uncharacterized protein TNCV_3353601 [Trichonephila clavipes]
MAPVNRCMSGNTCGCRMSWTYRWAVMVPQINTRQWHPVPSHQLWERCVAVKQRRPASIPLQSSFFVRGTTRNGGIDGWASRAEHVMGAAIPNVLQPDVFVWFEKTQGPLMKVLPLPRWQPMKQLAVRVHFLRCGGLFDDWCVEGVLSLVFV